MLRDRPIATPRSRAWTEVPLGDAKRYPRQGHTRKTELPYGGTCPCVRIPSQACLSRKTAGSGHPLGTTRHPGRPSIMWAVRLRIAYEAANVLAATSIDPFDSLGARAELGRIHHLAAGAADHDLRADRVRLHAELLPGFDRRRPRSDPLGRPRRPRSF